MISASILTCDETADLFALIIQVMGSTSPDTSTGTDANPNTVETNLEFVDSSVDFSSESVVQPPVVMTEEMVAAPHLISNEVICGS